MDCDFCAGMHCSEVVGLKVVNIHLYMYDYALYALGWLRTIFVVFAARVSNGNSLLVYGGSDSGV
jgi:hypothetical protein